MTDTPASAADRFRHAVLTRDMMAAAEEFAEDIKLFNPMSPDPLIGRDAVAAALSRLEAIFEDFEYLETFVNRDPSGPGVSETQALVFRASFGNHVLDGVDLLEVTDADQIGSFTVFTRPVTALMALGQALTHGPSRG